MKERQEFQWFWHQESANEDTINLVIIMPKENLPKPEGICPYCGKPIYIGLSKHLLICRLKQM
jgi:hypothetical protein